MQTEGPTFLSKNPTSPTPGHLNPIHILTTYSCKILFNITFLPMARSPK